MIKTAKFRPVIYAERPRGGSAFFPRSIFMVIMQKCPKYEQQVFPSEQPNRRNVESKLIVFCTVSLGKIGRNLSRNFLFCLGAGMKQMKQETNFLILFQSVEAKNTLFSNSLRKTDSIKLFLVSLFLTVSSETLF